MKEKQFRIKEMREAAGMSQQQVADALGIKKPRYGDWERETTMLGFDDAIQLADLFGCSLDALAGHVTTATYADIREKELHRVWNDLDRERQNRLIANAHDMELAKSNGNSSTVDDSVSA